MIEPILMDFNNKTWENPDIAELAFNYTTPSELNRGCFSGQLVRIIMSTGDLLLHIVAIAEEEFYIKLCDNELTDEDLDEFSSVLSIILFEDVWSPGEQFCFTDFGKSIAVFSNVYEYTISPDICIHYDGPGKGWGWSS